MGFFLLTLKFPSQRNVVKFALPRTSCSLAQFAITRGDLVTAKHLLEICSPEQLNRPSWRSCALLEVLKNESLLEFLLDNKCIREKFNPNISLLNVWYHISSFDHTSFHNCLICFVDLSGKPRYPSSWSLREDIQARIEALSRHGCTIISSVQI
jgi:hypothetical protein